MLASSGFLISELRLSENQESHFYFQTFLLFFLHPAQALLNSTAQLLADECRAIRTERSVAQAV